MVRNLFNSFKSYLSEDESGKRLLFSNGGYTFIIFGLVCYTYYVCWKAEFDVLTQKSLSFWDFITTSHFNNELRLIIQNYSVTNNYFNIFAIIILIIAGIFVGIFLFVNSIYALLDLYFDEIPQFKLIFLLFIVLTVLNLALFWIMSKYLFLLIIAILIILVLTLTKSTFSE